MSNQRRIAYVVNHAAFFVSHRLPLALGARDLGFDIQLFTGQAGSEQMEKAAVAVLATERIVHRRTISRSAGINPLYEILSFLQLAWFMIRFRPQVVHCASPKGVLYGGIAARLCRVHGLVLAVSGMGYAFTDTGTKSALRKIIKYLYTHLVRFAFKHPNVLVITQNTDDHRALINQGYVTPSRVELIPGSGVDLSLYDDCDLSNKKPIVLLPARMLKDKGVEEFVAAARMLRKLAPDWTFVLAGAAGYNNPTAISQTDLKEWQREGIVQWLGHVEDMVPLYKEASIVCLPSYREGMPKSLLEAAAAGCAVVTTDVTGCREAIVAGVTGELVPVRNVEALGKAILTLIQDKTKRHTYGNSGRSRAMSSFSIESVVRQTTKLYKRLIND